MPAALWALKGYPIVYQPFLIGFGIGLVLTVITLVSTLFKRQKLHGEARFARAGEVRNGKMLASAGIVLGKFGGKVMRFGGPEHVMLEAPTRAGKGVGVIIPNLLDWLDSLVVLDIKQENYDNTAGYRLKVLGQQVLLFNPLDPTGRTVRWNPLSYINRHDPVEVINELQKIAAMLYPDPLTGEKFWAEGARTAFLGITAYIAATVDDGDDALPFTLGEVYRQFAASDALRRFPKIIADRKKAGKPLSEGCVSAIKDYTGSSANTFSGLRQSVTSKINGWLNPYVDAATSESDFDLSDFRDKRISLYLGVSPDDLERVAPIYGLLFQQLIDRNVRELPKGDKHQIKVLLAPGRVREPRQMHRARERLQLCRRLWVADAAGVPIARTDPGRLWGQGGGRHRAKLRGAACSSSGRFGRGEEDFGPARQLHVQGAVALDGNVGRRRRLHLGLRSAPAADAPSGSRVAAGGRSDRFPARHVRNLWKEGPLLCREEALGADQNTRPGDAPDPRRPRRRC